MSLIFRKTSQLESEKTWPPIKATIANRIESVEIEGDCCWELKSTNENEEPEMLQPFDGLSGPRSFRISQINEITAKDFC